jgi:hypothetical protein
MTPSDIRSATSRLLEFLETGNAPDGLFTEDVFCDFTMPRWRLQARGQGPVVELRRRGHPAPGKVPRFRVDPLPNGFVLELEETWQEDDEQWYCREMLRVELRGDAIEALSVYCTGDWDRKQCEKHAREVQLLRP